MPNRFASVWLISFLSSATAPASATPYTYHSYETMVSELEALEKLAPTLVEHFTAQDTPADGGFELSFICDGGTGETCVGGTLLEIHVLRITNELTGLDKPEVLFIGVQHGDEIVSVEVCLALARLLVESHGVNPWLTELVDHREIFLVPIANPWGFNHHTRTGPGLEGSEDMNRDHPYDRNPCEFGCADEQALSTIGARAIHELARRHLFRIMLDFHGGAELILHPWGSPLHPFPADDISPDQTALGKLGLRMRDYGGPYSGFYPVHTANAGLGPVHGPLDDSSYATSWDSGNADPNWPTDGWRALGYTIEISQAKSPNESTLGGDAELLAPGGTEDGYVPKNVRIALAAVDIAEPYLFWSNRDDLPSQALPGSTLEILWNVRGCFEVNDTHVRLGSSPDLLDEKALIDQTPAQEDLSEDVCFPEPTTFTALLTLPSKLGNYSFGPVARVDAGLLAQSSPNPNVSPQSWIARARNETGQLFENSADPDEVNTIQGQLWWSAESLLIEVTDSPDTATATATTTPNIPNATGTPTASASATRSASATPPASASATRTATPGSVTVGVEPRPRLRLILSLLGIVLLLALRTRRAFLSHPSAQDQMRRLP